MAVCWRVLPDERKGHRIVAVINIELRKSIFQDLIDALNEQVSAYERIDEFRFVSEIPRYALSKVMRQDLLVLYEQAG